MNRPSPAPRTGRTTLSGPAQLAIVVAGIIAIQFILFGSSLAGDKILLPLDVLHDSAITGGAPTQLPQDPILHDPVGFVEPSRMFAISEVRAGRLPLWDPNNFCGYPFLAANQSAVFSPFRVLDYLWPDPRAIAWGQMLRALVGGVGAYFFLRRALRLRFLPSAFGAWLWPICGFLMLWTMWTISAAALWLPWILLSVHRCVRGNSSRPRWIIALAVFSAMSLLSGHSATSAHLLLGGGIYALWLLWISRNKRPVRGIAALAAGWTLAFCLAAPQLLPTMVYLRNSLRIEKRIAAGEETPPVGGSALPQLLFPWSQGATRAGWIYINSDIPIESAIGGYFGAMALLTFAPMILLDRRRRKFAAIWIALAVLGAGYIVHIPGATVLQNLPILNALRGNRFVVVTAFSFIAAAAMGMDALLRGRIGRGRFFWIIPTISLILMAWCLWRSTQVAELLGPHVEPALRRAQAAGIATFADMNRVVDEMTLKFATYYQYSAGICLLSAVAAIAIRRQPARVLVGAAGLLAIAEVLIQFSSVNPQTDRAMYQWDEPILRQLASAPPGRMVAIRSFPPMLNHWFGLSEIRGYDGADPKDYVAFLNLFATPDSAAPARPAATYNYTPRVESPLADFINLRYIVHPGPPPPGAGARFVSPGHYVVENTDAMPRVSVPAQAIELQEESLRLGALKKDNFDPRKSVVIEGSRGLPETMQGTARIIEENPTRIRIEFDMQTPGLVVLADRFDAGWRARIAGTEVVVLRANHAFRAAMVPAGRGELVFSYEPAEFTIGLWLAGFGVAGLIAVGKSSRVGIRRALPH